MANMCFLKIDENRVPLRSPRISKDIFKGFSITIILLAVGWQFGIIWGISRYIRILKTQMGQIDGRCSLSSGRSPVNRLRDS